MLSPRIFVFDEEVPMRFAILGTDASNLASMIITHGGTVTNKFHAHFALVDESEHVTPEMKNLPAQLVRKTWAAHSVFQSRLLPIYPYTCDSHSGSDPQAAGLVDLGESSRDLAELIKVAMDLKESLTDSETYGMLHRKYPHHTTRQWQLLCEDNKEKIQKAILITAADLEEELNDCILSLLSVPTVPTVEGGMKYEGDKGAMQIDDSHPLTGTGGMENDVEMEELESSEDDDSNHSELSTAQDGSSITTTFSQASNVKNRPGTRRTYTAADTDAMAIFLVDQGLTDGVVPLRHWVTFRKQNSLGHRRSAEAWNLYYSRHKEDITARSKELEARRLLQQGTQSRDEPVRKASPVGTSTRTPSIEGHDDMKSLFGSSVDNDVHPDTSIDANGLAGAEPKESASKELPRRLYDEPEVNAMVEFLAYHGLTDATESHWRQFRSEYSVGAKRTSNSLRKFYGRNKSVLDTQAHDLRASREHQQGTVASTFASHFGVPGPAQQDSVPALQEGVDTVMQGFEHDTYKFRSSILPSINTESEDGSDADDGDADFQIPPPAPVQKGQSDTATRSFYTEGETRAMVDFLTDQGLTNNSSHAGLSYWTTFCRLDPPRRNRTPNAWAERYRRNKNELTVRARALLATRVGGTYKEKPKQIEEKDSPDQGHRSSSSEGKQASIAGMGSTFRDESVPEPRSVEDDDMKSLFGSSADGDGDLEESPVVEQGSKDRLAGHNPARSLSQEEMQAMAGFIAERGLTGESSHVGLADWRTFREKTSSQMSRTPAAWQGQYSRHKAELTERAKAMLAAQQGQGQQYNQVNNATSTSATRGGDDTGRLRNDEHGPLPPGWQKFRSVSKGGMPFYYDAVNKVSKWDRPQF